MFLPGLCAFRRSAFITDNDYSLNLSCAGLPASVAIKMQLPQYVRLEEASDLRETRTGKTLASVDVFTSSLSERKISVFAIIYATRTFFYLFRGKQIARVKPNTKTGFTLSGRGSLK